MEFSPLANELTEVICRIKCQNFDVDVLFMREYLLSTSLCANKADITGNCRTLCQVTFSVYVLPPSPGVQRERELHIAPHICGGICDWPRHRLD